MTVQQEEPDWQIMNMIGRSYLSTLKTRVGCVHRLKKLEFLELRKRDLVDITKTNEQGDMKDWEVKEGFEEEAKKIINIIKDGRPYQILETHKDKLEREEHELLKDARDLFKTSAVWKFCENVKGLGPVAAMTFLSYIDPDKCTSAGKFFAYVGLVPTGRLRKGERGHFNPEIKGRLNYISKNMIRATDPYYYKLYLVKKDYFQHRIDFEDKVLKKVKGTPAKIDAKSVQWLTKLIVSHTIEIIRKAHDEDFPRHRNYLPPKPTDPVEQLRIIDIFREQQAAHLEETKRRIVEGYNLADAMDQLTGPVGIGKREGSFNPLE